MTSLDVVTAADGVHLAIGRDVNWIILTDGDDVTLIDSGYPRYIGQVMESLRRVGRQPEDVRAILLTHAHIDHIGGAAHFASTYGTPVLTSEVEARHARREFVEQAGPLDVVKNIYKRGVLPWSLRISRAGALDSGAVDDAEGFESVVGPERGGALDVPGAPVPVPSAGHTSGHTGYHLPSSGVVVTGDALVTGHALCPEVGPQMLPTYFTHDRSAEYSALDSFAALDADIILPGHGGVYRGDVSAAVASMRDGRSLT